MNSSGEGNTPSSSPVHPSTENIVAAVFVAVLIVLAVVGNLLVIASFYMFQELRTICNYFVVSLSAADVLVAVLAMPFWCSLQINNNKRPLGRELMLFWGCVDILCGTASIMNLAAVSMDRQCAITMPLSYPRLVTPKRAILTILFVWIYGTVVSTLRLAQWTDMGYYGYFVATTTFFLPLFIMIIMYSRIYIIARQHVRRISRNLATEVKAAKTIAVVIGCFILCWAPFFSIVVIYAYDRHFTISPKVVQVVKWLEYFNSCLNPIIYTCLNRTYRCAFKKLFVKLKQGVYARKRNKSGSTSSMGRGAYTRNSLSITMESSGNQTDMERSGNRCAGAVLTGCLGGNREMDQRAQTEKKHTHV